MSSLQPWPERQGSPVSNLQGSSRGDLKTLLWVLTQSYLGKNPTHPPWSFSHLPSQKLMSSTPQIPGINPTSPPPDHPPLSPEVSRPLSPKTDDLKTPDCSPPSNPQTPVIVSNPLFLPPPPLLPRYSPLTPAPRLPPRPDIGSELPQSSDRWDSLNNTPSYKRGNLEFW